MSEFNPEVAIEVLNVHTIKVGVMASPTHWAWRTWEDACVDAGEHVLSTRHSEEQCEVSHPGRWFVHCGGSYDDEPAAPGTRSRTRT